MFAVATRVGCTVAELGERMSAREFREWIAYILLEEGQNIRTLDTSAIGSFFGRRG
jgi:hypothetical protein